MARSHHMALWAVPARNPRFIGREDVLDRLHGVLQNEGRAVVTAVTGMGGVGKTALATEYAYRHQDEFDIAWWVLAEDRPLVGEQLADLARAMDLATVADTARVAVARLRAALRRRTRWLVVFDNAHDPREFSDLLPHGPGQVLITSRNPDWRSNTNTLALSGFRRQESIALLSSHVQTLDRTDAGLVAEAVGDLPLAVEQAASLIEDTGISADEYRRLLSESAAELFEYEQSGHYHVSVSAAWTVAFDRLAAHHPIALELLTVLAWLGPEPVPTSLLVEHADCFLPDEDGEGDDDRPPAGESDLRTTMTSAVARARCTAVLRRRALAAVSADTLQIHRVPAALLRARTLGDRRRRGRWAEAVGSLLHEALPSEVWNNPSAWSHWQQLLPHVLAVTDASRPATPAPLDLAWLLDKTGTYLQTRGDPVAALRLFERSRTEHQAAHGHDHEATLNAANNLALDLYALGEYARARALDEDTFARFRVVLGPDHPDTLTSASNLALDLHALGEYAEAARLNEDALERRLRELGPDHIDTLTSMSNLARNLRVLSEHRRAHDLDAAAHARCRATLGADHPVTLGIAGNLSLDLLALGESRAANDLAHEAVERSRTLLGENHPETLRSRTKLVDSERALHGPAAARDITRDVLRRRRRVLGDGHPDTVAAVDSLVADLTALGETTEAHDWQVWLASERDGPE